MLGKAIWDLLEIVFVDKHASSWITEQLFSWLEVTPLFSCNENMLFIPLALFLTLSALLEL